MHKVRTTSNKQTGDVLNKCEELGIPKDALPQNEKSGKKNYTIKFNSYRIEVRSTKIKKIKQIIHISRPTNPPPKENDSRCSWRTNYSGSMCRKASRKL